MAKKKGSGKGLGRENLKYVGLPSDLWEQLAALAETQDRSVSWMARQAVKEYLERNPPPAAAEPEAKGKGTRGKRKEG
jgi:hypothetical protein